MASDAVAALKAQMLGLQTALAQVQLNPETRTLDARQKLRAVLAAVARVDGTLTDGLRVAALTPTAAPEALDDMFTMLQAAVPASVAAADAEALAAAVAALPGGGAGADAAPALQQRALEVEAANASLAGVLAAFDAQAREVLRSGAVEDRRAASEGWGGGDPHT